jgi:AraC-like DNA-binding protein
VLTYSIIFCLIFQSALAIYLLGTTKEAEAFDIQIRKLLVVLLIHLSTKFLLLHFIGNAFPFAKTATGFTFFYGPFLLIITNQILQKPFAKKIVYLQLVPFFAGLLTYFSFVLLGSTGYIKSHFVNLYNNIYQILAIFSLISYSIIVKQKLKQWKDDSNQLIALQKQLLSSITSVWLIGIVSGLLIKSLHLAGSFFSWLDIKAIVYANLLMIPVLVIRYKVQSSHIRIPTVILPEEIEPEPVISVIEVHKKYEKSGIDDSLFVSYEEKIIKHMKKNKPYLNADLSLEDLSKQLAIPKHHITQTLNDKMEKSFYQFINEYRIEEAISKLKKSKEELSLLSLAFDVGFNSKSSFNMYFKKITGHTPSSYRKSILLVD